MEYLGRKIQNDNKTNILSKTDGVVKLQIIIIKSP